MAKVVPIADVRLSDDGIGICAEYQTKRQIAVLLKQGLIEPICVVQDETPPYIISSANWYDDYNLLAALELRWTTVIIAVDDSRLCR